MRHLILTLDFPPLYDGGIARSMDETARALAARGESVRVLTRGSGRDVKSHDAAYPAQVTRWWGHHWQKFHPFLLALHLPGAGKQERGAIVHTSTWEVASSVLRKSAKFGWKVFIHVHGREIARTFSSPRELTRLSATLKAADAILPVSRYVADLTRQAGAPAGRVHFTPNAIDARRVQGGVGDRFRARFGLGSKPLLLSLARLVDRKGQDTVIRALPRMLREVPELIYIVAGGGDYREELEKLARSAGVAEHVLFTGFITDLEIPDLYAAANVYVMVSREGREAGDIEGFGITYLEASAAGLPVVAGNSGGTADAVEQGVTGVLVDPTDSDAVGEAILGFLRDPARARAMGQAGRTRVEKEFSLATRADKIIRIAAALSGPS